MIKLKYIFNGTTERIPPIGSVIDLRPKQPFQFRVEGYGEINRLSDTLHVDTNESFELELEGVLIIPKGSPIEVLESLLLSGE